jgi:hypothetical protein
MRGARNEVGSEMKAISAWRRREAVRKYAAASARRETVNEARHCVNVGVARQQAWRGVCVCEARNR